MLWLGEVVLALVEAVRVLELPAHELELVLEEKINKGKERNEGWLRSHLGL